MSLEVVTRLSNMPDNNNMESTTSLPQQHRQAPNHSGGVVIGEVGVGSGSTNANNSSAVTDSRERKEERRRERRARRERRLRQRQSELSNQLDAFMYEGAAGSLGNHLPDLLNSHVPPPPYATLPPPQHQMAVNGGGNPLYPGPPTGHRGGWRASITSFSRRRRCDRGGVGGVGGMGVEASLLEDDCKTCCGVLVSQSVSIRWFIVMIAFVGICCAVVGTVLGAMKASGREHLTVSLLMIGVGIVLITVSGIAWRLTNRDAPNCRAMMGLDPHAEYGDGRFLAPAATRSGGHHAFPRGGSSNAHAHAAAATNHPYAGMLYSEFQYRAPPPSYQASMQEYRLRLLLMDRSNPPPPPPLSSQQPQSSSQQSSQPIIPPLVSSPPPAYRGPPPSHPYHRLMLPPSAVQHHQPDSYASRPPSYRSRVSEPLQPAPPSTTASSHQQFGPVGLPQHSRHASQLSYLSSTHQSMVNTVSDNLNSVGVGGGSTVVEPKQQPPPTAEHASVVPVIPGTHMHNPHKASIMIHTNTTSGHLTGDQSDNCTTNYITNIQDQFGRSMSLAVKSAKKPATVKSGGTAGRPPPATPPMSSSTSSTPRRAAPLPPPSYDAVNNVTIVQRKTEQPQYYASTSQSNTSNAAGGWGDRRSGEGSVVVTVSASVDRRQQQQQNVSQSPSTGGGGSNGSTTPEVDILAHL